jgi:hypothetical protein
MKEGFVANGITLTPTLQRCGPVILTSSFFVSLIQSLDERYQLTTLKDHWFPSLGLTKHYHKSLR